MWKSKYISVLFVVIGAALLLAGCSSTGGGADSGGSSGGDSSGSAQADSEKTTAAPEPTRMSEEKPSGKDKPSGKETKAGKKASSPTATGFPVRPSAFEGLEKAGAVAKNWNGDAELYSIASVSPEVDAEGRSPVWLYSYVSDSGKGVALISVEKGKAKLIQEPPVPESQIQRILGDTLPPTNKLIDSSEAMDRATKIKQAIQKNPDARVSAGLDAVSGNEPTWTLASISESGPVQEQVPASP